jgi:hypothetical protein
LYINYCINEDTYNIINCLSINTNKMTHLGWYLRFISCKENLAGVSTRKVHGINTGNLCFVRSQ